MNEQLIAENKKKLEVELARLRKLLSREGKFEGSGEFPGQYKPKFQEAGADEDENAQEVTGYETSLGVTADLEEKLTRVESALKRIDAGTYNQCIFGDEIEEDRLRVLPEADDCFKHSK